MIYDLFTRSMALPEGDRADFLQAQCADENIIERVMALINADVDGFTLSGSVKNDVEQFHQHSPKIGDVVSVFRLTNCLGNGGMGTVFQAQRIDGSFDQTVAIKIISPHLYHFFDAQHLNTEANFMAKLSHNNICSVFDAGITDEGTHFIVMEYIEGQSVDHFFDHGGNSITDKLNKFIDLCEAVNFAHQKHVVHGDLKPANILLKNNGQIKVLDFGISHLINEQNALVTNQERIPFHAMTTQYASPELTNGDKPTVYSDVYALGKILAALIAHSPNRRFQYLSELEAIVLRATAHSVTNRYASVSEMRSDIQLYLRGYVADAYRANHLYRLRKFALKRYPIAVTSGVVFMVVCSLLIINLFNQHNDLQHEKYQTDVMLEKFSLVLDLDYNAKSDVEMSLANNYESRDKMPRQKFYLEKLLLDLIY